VASDWIGRRTFARLGLGVTATLRREFRIPQEVLLKVELNESLTAGTFRVVKSPETAKPQTEEQAQKVEVTVRKVGTPDEHKIVCL
jgi:hypothetical protein